MNSRDSYKMSLTTFLFELSCLFWDIKNLVASAFMACYCSEEDSSCCNSNLICCCFIASSDSDSGCLGVIVGILLAILLIIVAFILIYVGGLLLFLSAFAFALLVSQFFCALAGLLDNNFKIFGFLNLLQLLIIFFCGYELFQHAIYPLMQCLFHMGSNFLPPVVLHGLALSVGLALSMLIISIVTSLFIHFIFPKIMGHFIGSGEDILPWFKDEGETALSEREARKEQAKSWAYDLIVLGLGASSGYGVYTALLPLTWWVAASMLPSPLISAAIVSIIVTFVLKVIILSIVKPPKVQGMFDKIKEGTPLYLWIKKCSDPDLNLPQEVTQPSAPPLPVDSKNFQNTIPLDPTHNNQLYYYSEEFLKSKEGQTTTPGNLPNQVTCQNGESCST